jgi:hypothetical protein
MDRPPGIVPESVVIPGRLAAKLVRELSSIRGRLERDEELSMLLSRLRWLAAEWQADAVGGPQKAPRGETDASSSWMTTERVGVFFGRTARWVRSEIASGRLPASRVGPRGPWMVERRDAEALREMRKQDA